MTDSTNPDLSFSLYSDWLRCVLRVDAIRRDTLHQLGQTWAEDDGRADIERALDALAELTVGSATATELDAAVDAVDDAGCSEHADVRITLPEALRLRGELDSVIARLSRFGAKVPQQRTERGAA